jgi:RNA polymerase sigma factor (sigma-70 family)
MFPTWQTLNRSAHHQLFDHWIRDHGTILHHVANGFAEGDDRQDLMQELLLAVWKSVPAFRQDAQASTFIYRVSHNAALTWRRSRLNYRRRVDGFAALAAASPPDAPPDASSAQLERVYAAIRRLPPLDRSLILLSLDGVSYRDMAAIHGLTESNIGVRLNRARHALSASLKKADHEL